MTYQVDCVVIGAGVVGLACARALARAGHEVVVIERNGRIGAETSSRSSEVIHAGIYYRPGSLKARLCVRGKAMLYDFCEQYGVPFRRCGKIIVATHGDQLTRLRDYAGQAAANGAGELQWLGRHDVLALEPAVEAVAGLWSPTTGIIDSHAYMESLAGDFGAHGGVIAFATEVLAAERYRNGLRLTTTDSQICARWVVNAAGLDAPKLARRLARGHRGGLPGSHYAKGHYYVYTGRSPFRHLVYPVADAAGLGVHVTLDLGGQARFGPDVQWIPAPDYRFDTSGRADFVDAIRRYFPGVEPSRLQPGYTGIRPKIVGPGAPSADFAILGPQAHGVDGLVHLLGIESPGLTAALAIAELVHDRIRDGAGTANGSAVW